MTTTEHHDPVTCPDCTKLTERSGNGYVVGAIRYCPVARAESVARREQAARDYPELAALKRRFGVQP